MISCDQHYAEAMPPVAGFPSPLPFPKALVVGLSPSSTCFPCLSFSRMVLKAGKEVAASQSWRDCREST